MRNIAGRGEAESEEEEEVEKKEEEEENEIGRDGRAVRLDCFPDAELNLDIGGDPLEGRPKAILTRASSR